MFMQQCCIAIFDTRFAQFSINASSLATLLIDSQRYITRIIATSRLPSYEAHKQSQDKQEKYIRDRSDSRGARFAEEARAKLRLINHIIEAGLELLHCTRISREYARRVVAE